MSATPTLCDRIEAAEALARELVSRVERVEAAGYAFARADPYSRPTCEQFYLKALRASAETFVSLSEACEELGDEGVAPVAQNLLRNALLRCEVARGLAAGLPERKESFALGFQVHQPTPLAPRPGPPADQTEGVPRLRQADLPRPAGRPPGLRPSATVLATEGGGR